MNRLSHLIILTLGALTFSITSCGAERMAASTTTNLPNPADSQTVLAKGDDRFDLSRIMKVKGVQKIYLPQAAINDGTMWNLLQTDNFLGSLKGADDFLLLVLRDKDPGPVVTETINALKNDKHYKLLFEVDNSATMSSGIAFVRPSTIYLKPKAYDELIFFGYIGFPRTQMVIQVTGQLSQEQIDNFVSTYFNH